MRLLQPPQYLIRTPEPFIAVKLENVDRNPPSFGRANSDILPRPNHYGPHTFAEKIYFIVPRVVLKRRDGMPV